MNTTFHSRASRVARARRRQAAARRSVALSGERFSLGSFVMHSARKPKSPLQRYMLLRKGKDILA